MGSVLIVHRALTPYRIDLFNALYSRYGCDIYFEEKEAENHSFNLEKKDRKVLPLVSLAAYWQYR